VCFTASGSSEGEGADVTARLTLGRLRYDSPYGITRPCPGGRVQIEHGDADEPEQSLPFGPDCDAALGQPPSLGHNGFVFDGDVVVSVYETGADAPIATFTFDEADESAGPDGAWPWRARSGRGPRYTLSFRVDRIARDDGPILAEGQSAGQECRVNLDEWSCFTPTESMLIFRPLYNERQLKVHGTSNRVGQHDPARAAYVAAVAAEAAAHPDNRQPWWRRARLDADGNVIRNRRGRPVTDCMIVSNASIPRPNDMQGTFDPGARRFCDYWGIEHDRIHPIDNGIDVSLAIGNGHSGEGNSRAPQDRFSDVLDVCDDFAARLGAGDVEPLSAVAFFCHGVRLSFQLGPRRITTHAGRRELGQLAEHIKSVSREDVVVILYACSTAQPPNDGTNFAARLRDELIAGTNARPYCRVVGHMAPGHAFHIPQIMYFEGSDGAGAPGVELAPEEPAAPRAGTLRDRFEQLIRLRPGTDHSGFVWAYPFMSVAAVQAVLRLDDIPDGAYDEPGG
jgi:hypothetical protein